MCGRRIWDCEPCPGRGAAFFVPLRRAGTVPTTGVRYGPGSAAHRFANSYALRCVRGTERASILHAVAMQIVARRIQPFLGAVDMVADPRDHPPEPWRVVHLDQM